MSGHDADLVVVGGGPVGLLAAVSAARAGLRTVVVERRAGTVDKACGEGLMPAGLVRLAGLGIDPPGHPLTGVTYRDGAGHAVSARFTGGPGRGVRRTVLHASLLDAARSAGVEVVHDHVQALVQDDGRRDAVRVRLRGGETLHAGHVVAADGLHSPTRHALGLDRPAGGPRRHGLRRHFALAPWSNQVEVHWGARGEAYVTPVAPDLVGVALLTDEVGTFDDLLEGFPALAHRVLAGDPVDDVRGAGPLRQGCRRPVAGRVLLVGDAAGYVDAVTGEGLTLGWAQAQAAVDAVLAGDPARYARRHALIGAAGRSLTRTLVGVARVPVVRREIVRVAGRAPVLFEAAVQVAASGR